MVRLLKTWVLVGSGALLLATSGWGEQRIGRPGAVNYVEGQAYLNGSLIGSKEMGQVEAATGQVLSTEDGKPRCC